METYIVRVNGVEYEVEVEKKNSTVSGTESTAAQAAPASGESAPSVSAVPQAAPAAAPGSIEVKTGTAGKIWKISSKPGDVLEAGDTVLVIEAMKMEIPVVAPEKGELVQITVAEGEEVKAGQVVATLK